MHHDCPILQDQRFFNQRHILRMKSSNLRMNGIMCDSCLGITQEDVDKAQTFPEVFRQFKEWLTSHRLGEENRRYAIVTDGCVFSLFRSLHKSYFLFLVRKRLQIWLGGNEYMDL